MDTTKTPGPPLRDFTLSTSQLETAPDGSGIPLIIRCSCGLVPLKVTLSGFGTVSINLNLRAVTCVCGVEIQIPTAEELQSLLGHAVHGQINSITLGGVVDPAGRKPVPHLTLVPNEVEAKDPDPSSAA